MTFKTVDEAYQFYSYYAYRIGFGIAKTCSRRKDGVQHEYTFSCEKTRISKKTGCQAKFRVRLNEDGLWHLAFLVLHHNHYCSPNESHRYRSHKMTLSMPCPMMARGYQRAIPRQRLLLECCSAGFINRGRTCWKETLKPLLNILPDAEGEPTLLSSDGFGWEGRLQNIFWADTRSRMSYPYFNDVILLDTSCLSSKNGSIPFASFTGVNHHGSAVFFGGALLCNDSPETYAWLFQAWLASMDHEEDPGALAGRSNQKAAKERLHNIVFDSLKPDEFEENWAAMINEFKLGDSEWLLSLYKERRRWVPTFVKDTFWAGMSGIQRSDIRAPYFDRFVTSKSSLKQFLPAFEAALLASYNKEFQEEHGGEFQAPPPPLISRLSMEEDFSKAYTLNMFQRFQQELQKCVDCTCILIRKDGAISTYQVKERVKQRTYSYEVLFNEDQVEVQCLCRGFEFGGILCSHAIVVLKEKDVQRAPPRFF
ncbi:unnamed protein product [Spirodela intermedia]|uniref:Protein FAR1-RELATED SEQUENCE n=1 Tax=Spirodela intermedia TaxID=51605 RepID=A0ABN7EC98_SPIIN|nr:unnamed protein product [Spirodela intermedia]